MNAKNVVKFPFKKADLEAGRRLFGTGIGFKNYMIGKTRNYGIRLGSNWEEDIAQTPQINQLKERGFLNVGDLYQTELIEEIQNGIERYIDTEDSYVRASHEGEVYSKSIFNVHKKIPQISNLITNDVVNLIENYLGTYVSIKSLYYWRNYGIPEEIAKSNDTYSNYWHVDVRHWDTPKLFINLSDVSKEHGPFHFIPDPDSKKVSRRYAQTARVPPKRLREESNVEVIKACGEAGTGLLCHTQRCWHRAGTPKLGNIRDIIQFEFRPSTTPLKKNWMNDIEIKPIEKKMRRARK